MTISSASVTFDSVAKYKQAARRHNNTQKTITIQSNKGNSEHNKRIQDMFQSCYSDLGSLVELSFQHHRSKHTQHRPLQRPPQPPERTTSATKSAFVTIIKQKAREKKAPALTPQGKVTAYPKYKQ